MDSLILMGFSQVRPSQWGNMHGAVGSWDREGQVRDGLPH